MIPEEFNRFFLLVLLQVKLSPQIAIENGLKLMENCFERHQVNLDPSSGNTKTSTVYRPIDKYRGALPHLIGSNEWKERWHVGLLDNDTSSQATPEPSRKSEDSNNATSSSLQASSDRNMSAGPSIRASQESLARSVSSVGDQMVINQPSGLFDDLEQSSNASSNLAPSSFFRPQVEQRKIVNLFDDEPPSLDPSPISDRRAVNVIDDYGSIESISTQASDANEKLKFQQPVDLFNDNDFDNFIKKIEKQEPVARQDNSVQVEVKRPEVRAASSKMPDMKALSEEIKNVHLKKFDKDAEDVKKSLPKKSEIVKEAVKVKEPERPKLVQPNVAKPLVKQEPEKPLVVEEKPRTKKITNLFDDDDDQDDYFSEILKQKSTSKATEISAPKLTQNVSKSKFKKLFDDDDDNDDAFGDIFAKKPANKLPEEGEPSKSGSKTVNSLFGDDEVPSVEQTKSDTLRKKTNLFEDDESDIFKTKLEVPRKVEKSIVETKEEIGEAFERKTESVMSGEKTTSDAILKRDEEKKAVESEVAANIENDDLKQPDAKRAYAINKPEAKNEPVDDAAESAKDQSSIFNSTPTKNLTTPLPFLNDVPPDDDDWESDEHFEEPEPVVASKPSSFPTVPIFDELPPDDDFVPPKVLAPDFNFDSEDEPDPLPSKSSPPLPVPDLKPATNLQKETEVKPKEANPKVPVSETKLLASTKSPAGVNTPESNTKPSPTKSPSLLEKIAKLETKVQTNVKASSTEAKVQSDVKAETKTQSSDETDRSAVVGDKIKSKLESLNKKVDKPVPVLSPARKTPGKLSMNLNINVGALMPGARLPPKPAAEQNSPSEEEDAIKPVSKVRSQMVLPPVVRSPSAPVVSSSRIDSSDNSKLLNNELAKSRARIQVKRRPSTRRGRQEIYEKSLSMIASEEALEDEAQNKRDKLFPSASSSKIAERSKTLSKLFTSASSSMIVNRSQNLSSSVFDELDDEDEFEPETKKSGLEPKVTKNPLLFDDEPPPSEPKPSAVQTNKISVFYDDEDDTRLLVEKQKKDEEQEKKKDEEQEKLSQLKTESKTTTTVEAKVESTNLSQSVFGEDSDEDLFGKFQKPAQKNAPASQSVKSKQSSSLFDDGDDDELFPTSKKPVTAPLAKKASTLFDSDDEAETISKSKPKPAEQPKKQSLFGDEDSDDGDLFSSKPKCKFSDGNHSK